MTLRRLTEGVLRIGALTLSALMLVRLDWEDAAQRSQTALFHEGITFRGKDGPRPPDLWLTLSGCDSSQVEGACARMPNLQIERVDQWEAPSPYLVYVRLGGRTIECPAISDCVVALEETPSGGIEIGFWAQSPEGMRGELYTARIRVLPALDPMEGGETAWYVQVLSSQWIGDPVDACAVAWDTFPPLASLPEWLTSPAEPQGIASEVMYHHLASRLIAVGAVDVKDCPDGGLMGSGAPSACGTEKAGPTVFEWQNQFDEMILDAAGSVRVPATLIKNVIAQESQFWPGSVVDRGEYGLGHLTELGADNTLLWNKELYAAFCPSVLGDAYCGSGYAHQSDYRRALLRGSLIAGIDADCADCEWGVDLGVARNGIQIIAEALLAYCSQTGRMVANVTGEAPGRNSSYEEMWKLTLASYAAGPGCLAGALKDASRRSGPLSWESVSSEISGECAGVIDYVENITR